MFVPVAIETWHHQAVELVQEIGRRTANITGDARESNFLFQQLSVALQRENAVSFVVVMLACFIITHFSGVEEE